MRIPLRGDTGRGAAASRSCPGGSGFQAESARPAWSAGAPRKRVFPRQCVGDDGLQIVKARLPSERGTDALAGGHDVRRVARPPRGELDLEIDARHALDGLDDVQHRMSAAAAAIERGGWAAGAQIGERLAMRGDEIADVDVIADAGTV